MPVINAGDGTVFFDQVVASGAPDDLISVQLDPSQPKVQGLSTVTGPLVVDRHLSRLTGAFDPEQFDLSKTSHITKILNALVNASGIGGLRKQQTIARLGIALSGTSFAELDSFWGAFFQLTRTPEEILPSVNNAPINPTKDVADSATWDVAEARNGRYRNRIEQLARAFSLGGTYEGIRMAAVAILAAEVEVVESWTEADFATSGAAGNTQNTYTAIAAQYGTYGQMTGHTWGTLALGTPPTSETPLGNRGEITIIPGRNITEAERLQLHTVLDVLAPAGTMITISATPFTMEVELDVRSVHADSEEWTITSKVSSMQSLISPQTVYADGVNDSARPAMSEYTGEEWSYNGRVATVTAYALNAEGGQLDGPDYQSVTFTDGTTANYLPGDALVDSRRVALARASSEAVLTTFPYVEGRM